jgi:hypothetical protein
MELVLGLKDWNSFKILCKNDQNQKFKKSKKKNLSKDQTKSSILFIYLKKKEKRRKRIPSNPICEANLQQLGGQCSIIYWPCLRRQLGYCV